MSKLHLEVSAPLIVFDLAHADGCGGRVDVADVEVDQRARSGVTGVFGQMDAG